MIVIPTETYLNMVTMATMTWSKVMLLLSFILLQVAWVDAYSIDDSCARQYSMLSLRFYEYSHMKQQSRTL